MENWYLLKTKPRQEKKAKQNLKNQGYLTFCPIKRKNTKFFTYSFNTGCLIFC